MNELFRRTNIFFIAKFTYC